MQRLLRLFERQLQRWHCHVKAPRRAKQRKVVVPLVRRQNHAARAAEVQVVAAAVRAALAWRRGVRREAER
jgi:hypothetical protein